MYLQMALFLFPALYMGKTSVLSGALFFYIKAVFRQKERSIIMLQPCQDDYNTSFSTLNEMLRYHTHLAKESTWERTEVNNLHVAPLDKDSPLYSDISAFAKGVSEEAIQDTAKNLGLAIKLNGAYYPVRSTAYKGLLDRAKISGSSLPKLGRGKLAGILNSCLKLYPKTSTLVLVRDEKISATHSGDERDYSILEIHELLGNLRAKLDKRFPGNRFESGYSDHALTSASWSMPAQREDLLGSYEKLLAARGKSTLVSKLMPGIQFSTSDTGVASAKVSALLIGDQYPIYVGGMLAVEHRWQKKIEDFDKELDQLFAQFGDSLAKLEKLENVELEYPVNTMTRICKKLSMPKKEALNAIAMFEMAYGGGSATAHDVFMAMQEIPFLLKSQGHPESKLIVLGENMARALSLDWSKFDLAKAVEY